MKSILILAAMLFSLSATAFASDAHTAIEAQNAKFIAAYNAGDAAGVAAVYTQDAVIMPPDGAAITGHDAVAAFWQSEFDSGSAGATLTTLEVVKIDDNNAVERAQFEVFNSAGASLSVGKYVVYWRKTGDGWLMHWDIWNVGQ